jgi:hypothetical protein
MGRGTWRKKARLRRFDLHIQHHRQFTGLDSNLDIITVNAEGSSFLKVHHRPYTTLVLYSATCSLLSVA